MKTKNNKQPVKKTSKARDKKPNSKRIDYDKLKAEYVSDSTATYYSLGKKYGVSESSISRKARQENWKSLREVASNSVVENVIDDKKARITEANKRHSEGSIALQEAALKGIHWINNFSEDMVKGRGKNKKVTKDVPGPVLFSKQLSELVASYRRAADLERNVLGLANNVTKFGDEDGDEQPIIYDIMGGAANATSSSGTSKPTTPASS